MLCGVTTVVVLLSNAWSQTPTPCGDQTLKRNLLLFLIVFSSEVTHADFGLFLVDRNSVGGRKGRELDTAPLILDFLLVHRVSRKNAPTLAGRVARTRPSGASMSPAARTRLLRNAGTVTGEFPTWLHTLFKGRRCCTTPCCVSPCVCSLQHLCQQAQALFLPGCRTSGVSDQPSSLSSSYSRCDPNHCRYLLA